MELLIFALLATHFVADFVLQSDWMALNKSTRFDALTLHVMVYSLAFIPAMLWIFGNVPAAMQFVTITAVAHCAQDAITSRINTKLWHANERHWFFVAIGFDQLLHYAQLIGTLHWLAR